MSGHNGSEKALIVHAAGRRFAIPLRSVREIARNLRCVPLPGAPIHVLGLTGFRGEPLAVVDLSSLAGHAAAPDRPDAVVVVDLGRDESLGLAVDEVHGVTTVSVASGGPAETAFAAVDTVDGLVEIVTVDRLRVPGRPAGDGSGRWD